MKFLTTQIIFIALVICAAHAQDPVKIAPAAYQTTFENEFVKVQRVTYTPRVKIPEHDHTGLASAYVYLNDAGPVNFKHIGLDYGTVTRPAVKAGSFRLYKAVKETHEVENVSDTTSNFLRVEFKTEPAKDPNTLRGKFFRVDVPTNENFQTVQFENEQVRITRIICAAGKNCLEVANAKEPILFVILNETRFKIAKVNEIKLSPGDTHWIPAGISVAGVNISNTAAEILRFDFKTQPAKNIAANNTTDHAHKLDPAQEKLIAEASALLKEAAALASAGKRKESIAAHEKALALNPALVQAHINLISLYGRDENFSAAEKNYRAALQINPDLPDLHFNYGVLLMAQNRPAEALPAFQQCLQLNPYYAEAHFNVAAIIERDGKLDDAAAHYRQAIANKSGYRAAHFSLGRILVNQDKLSEAIAAFQNTLTPEDEDTPRYMYALGATYIHAGNKVEGMKFLRAALQRATTLHQTQLVNSIERDLKTLGQ